MAGKLSELWKRGNAAPDPADIPIAGLSVDVRNRRVYSKDENNEIFEIGESIDGGGVPDETSNEHKSMTNHGEEGDTFWSPFVTSPNGVFQNFTIPEGASATIVSPDLQSGVEITISEGSTLVIL